jgi:hypothetical protein
MRARSRLLFLPSLLLLSLFLGGCSGGLFFDRFLADMGLGALAGYNTVWKQNWGHYCCVQEDAYDIVDPWRLSQKDTYRCSAYTDQCEITIKNVDTGSWTINSFGEYSVCSSSGCSASTYYNLEIGQYKSFIIPYGSYVVFDTGLDVLGEEDTEITLRAKSFYLKGVENGRVYRQESCVLNPHLKSRTLQDGLNELSKTGANQCQNYLIDFVSVATQTYTYNGQEVVCQARQLYGIDPQQFMDGQVRQLQGAYVASVQCCPTEPNCDANTFRFVEINPRECTYDAECPNGGNPVAVSDSSYVSYTCLEGRCSVSPEHAVECTNSIKCIERYGSGWVCDLSPANWGRCKPATVSGFCGDGVCESIEGENDITCPADCLGSWPWYFYVLLIGGLILLFYALRPVLKRLPYVGRYLP